MNLPKYIEIDPVIVLGLLFIAATLMIVTTIQAVKLYKRAIQIAINKDEIDKLIHANYETGNLLQKAKVNIDSLISRNKSLSEVTAEAINALKTYKNGR